MPVSSDRNTNPQINAQLAALGAVLGIDGSL